MKSSELSNGENRIALRQLLQHRKWRHLWRHNLGSRWKLQKMAWESFSIGAFYNITKKQNNPIKTVGRDSFLSPKTPKNTSFQGSPSPQGSHSPYILGDTTRPRHITYHHHHHHHRDFQSGLSSNATTRTTTYSAEPVVRYCTEQSTNK